MALRLAVGFNEGSGTTFTPSVGPGAGSVVATYGQWITGVHGGALGRSGVGGTNGTYSSLTGLSSLDTASWAGITLMAWVRPHNATDAARYPITLLDGGGNDWMGWTISFNSDQFSGYFRNVTSANSGNVAASDTWVHLCSTWDGVELKTYANGVLAATAAVSGPVPALASIAVGSPPWGNGGAFGIDDLRLYDEALTATQISNLKDIAVGNESVPTFINKLRINNVAVGALRVGTTQINRVYKGSLVVYGESTGVDIVQLRLSPESGSHSLGSTIDVTIYADMLNEEANAVQANLTYQTSRLQFQSIDTSMSPFTTTLESTGGAGSVRIGVGLLGGTVTGSQVVGVVRFTAVGAGGTAISFAAGSGIADASTSNDISQDAKGATYAIS